MPKEAYLLVLGRGLDVGISLLFPDEGKTLELRNHYSRLKTIFKKNEEFAHRHDFSDLTIQLDEKGNGSAYLNGNLTVERISSSLE